MRVTLFLACLLLAACCLTGGCRGREASKGTRPSPTVDTSPTEGGETAEAAARPEPVAADDASASGRRQTRGEAGTRRARTVTLTPSQVSVQPGLAPQDRPALPGKPAFIPTYPGAKTEAGEQGKVVLTTSDSIEKVEAYYLKRLPQAQVLGRGKVGDQPFVHLVAGSGATEQRVFLSRPTGLGKTRIELTGKHPD